MSIKRSFNDTFKDDHHDDCNDGELEQILSIRKFRKHKKDEFIGFCDICEKLTSVREDPEQPQFNYCIDCEIGELSFITEFMGIGSKPIIEEQCDNIDQDDDNDNNDDNNDHDDNNDNNDNDDDNDKQSEKLENKHPTCWGCRSPFQPNQLAHMDYGGCLYNDLDNLDDSDESE